MRASLSLSRFTALLFLCSTRKFCANIFACVAKCVLSSHGSESTVQKVKPNAKILHHTEYSVNKERLTACAETHRSLNCSPYLTDFCIASMALSRVCEGHMAVHIAVKKVKISVSVLFLPTLCPHRIHIHAAPPLPLHVSPNSHPLNNILSSSHPAPAPPPQHISPTLHT